MLHIPALPGSPRFGGDVRAVRDAVLRDADTLIAAGVHGLMLENFGDVPFYKSGVSPITVAHMSAIAWQVKQQSSLPLGINCLRNDACAALSIAHAAGAEFIRVNVLSGARVTDQGVIEGCAADLMRLRRALGAESIKVLADVDVKHSSSLGSIDLDDEVEDVIARGLADGLIVSGAGTGKSTDVKKVQRVHKAAKKTPVFVGSGVSVQTIKSYLPHARGVIVGTYFKTDGKVDQPVDPGRVSALMDAIA